ncbi:MAG: hypothetical protein OXS33_02240 [bacterium]|nr:hypothetical protein [bacterium]
MLVTAWKDPIPVGIEKAMSAALRRDIGSILDSNEETARVVALALREEVLLILSS